MGWTLASHHVSFPFPTSVILKKKAWPNPGITRRMHFNKGKRMAFLLTLQRHSGPQEGLVWIVRITSLAASSKFYMSWKQKYMYPVTGILSPCSAVSQVLNGGSDGHWSHSCLTACLRPYFFLSAQEWASPKRSSSIRILIVLLLCAI